MLHAGLKAGALFLASLLALYILLKTLLPPIDDEHRDRVKLPKTFEELKGLNEVLQASLLAFRGAVGDHKTPRPRGGVGQFGTLTPFAHLQVYKTRHYYRVLGCYTTVYLL